MTIKNGVAATLVLQNGALSLSIETEVATVVNENEEVARVNFRTEVKQSDTTNTNPVR